MMAQYLFFLILFTAILIHAFLGWAPPRYIHPLPTQPTSPRRPRVDEAALRKSAALHSCDKDICELPRKAFILLDKRYLQGYGLFWKKKKRRRYKRVFEGETRWQSLIFAFLNVAEKVLKYFSSQFFIMDFLSLRFDKKLTLIT